MKAHKPPGRERTRPFSGKSAKGSEVPQVRVFLFLSTTVHAHFHVKTHSTQQWRSKSSSPRQQAWLSSCVWEHLTLLKEQTGCDSGTVFGKAAAATAAGLERLSVPLGEPATGPGSCWEPSTRSAGVKKRPPKKKSEGGNCSRPNASPSIKVET